jgi:hypothetical protein
MKETPPPSGKSTAEIDASRFEKYSDDEVRKILDRAYKAGAPQGIIDTLETELDRREREDDDPSGGDDEPNRSNTGWGIEELMWQSARRGRTENLSPAQLGAEIRIDGDFAVMTQASPLATVSDDELGQEAYDALRAHEERIAVIRNRMSTRPGAAPNKMANNHTEKYRGSHRAPGRDGARADDMTMNGVYPADVYTKPEWYESGEGLKEMYKIMRLRGRPDAPVWIFRSVPRSVAGPLEGRSSRMITSGDWVSTSKEYAKEHGDSALGGDYIIASRRVRAGEIYTEGNSIFEWGYIP